MCPLWPLTKQVAGCCALSPTSLASCSEDLCSSECLQEAGLFLCWLQLVWAEPLRICVQSRKQKRDTEKEVPQMLNMGNKACSQPSFEYQEADDKLGLFWHQTNACHALSSLKLLTSVSKCESELAPDHGDHSCVSGKGMARSQRLATWVVLRCLMTRKLGSGHWLQMCPSWVLSWWLWGEAACFFSCLIDMFPTLGCAPSCGEGSKAASYVTIQQVFIEHLLYARHCSKHRNRAKAYPCFTRTYMVAPGDS